MKEFKINSDNTIDIDLRKNTLLEASAGTGKTYSLERVVLNLVKDIKYDLSIKDILVVTFTNKATREMKERIRAILIEDYRLERDPVVRKRLEDAIGSFDEAAIFTIHGFCQNTLQTFPFESHSLFNQEINQDESLLNSAVWDYLRKLESSEDNDLLDEYYAFRGKKSFSEVVSELIKLYNREEFRGGIKYSPDTQDINEFYTLRDEFNRGEGDLYNSVEGLKIPSSQMFYDASKAMGASTKLTSFEKLVSGFNSVDLHAGFYNFMTLFYEKGFCENAFKMSSDFLESKKGRSVGEMEITHRELILNIDEFFAVLDPVFDSANLNKNPVNKILAGEFIKKSLKEIDTIFKENQAISGLLSYGDLIENLHSRVMEEGENPLLNALRKKYKVALIDEFQDTDLKQWDIFNRIFGQDREHNFFLIGDPKQSIYGFRGADLEIYYKAKESVDRENRFFLGTNYRSEAGIVEAGNTLFEMVFGIKSRGNTVPTEFQRVSNCGKKEREIDKIKQNVEFLLYDKEVEPGKTLKVKECKQGYFKTVVDKVIYLLTRKSGDLKPGDISILVESHKDSIYLRDSLLYRGVPVVISKHKNVYCSSEAQHILLLLRALNRPGGIGEVKAALLSPLFDYSLKEIHEMEDSGELEVISTQFLMWSQGFNNSEIIGLWKELESYSKKGHLQTRILSTLNGERAYTNYTHLVENLNRIQRNERLNPLTLYQRLLHLTLSASEDEENSIRLDRESEAVQIMTIHASKGLEFPVVFFAGGLTKSGAGSGDYGIKYAEKNGEWTLDFLSRGRSKEFAERDEWEEKKRLYYVAFTRASSKIYLPLIPNGELMVINSLYASIEWDENRLMLEDRAGDTLEMCEQPIHKQLKLKKGKKSTELKRAYIQKNYEDVVNMVNKNRNLFHIDDSTYMDNSFRHFEIKAQEETLYYNPLKNSRGFRERVTWVSSYSGLTKDSHGSTSKEDADREDDEEVVIPIYKKSDEINCFNIPGGATFGDLIHEFFEQVKFDKYKLSIEEFLIDEDVHAVFLLEAKKHFDLDWAKKYEEVTKRIIWNTLNSRLDMDGELVALGTFHKELRIHEREFYFRVDINNSFDTHNLELKVEEGYLKGFIDLILNHNGKYYIADWKTTTIKGIEDFTDYNLEAVERSMNEHSYHLQGLIYTVALYLYLKNVKKDFNYSRDIGGYFYFFVRGMHPDKNTGISFYKPTEDEVIDFIREIRG